MVIPDAILVPALVLLGCAFAIGWVVARLVADADAEDRANHRGDDPARCPICRATTRDPWWKPADDLSVRRRLDEYVAVGPRRRS